jgi:hypothetical protein
MIIKDQHEKIQQAKEEVIILRKYLDNGPVTPIIKDAISRLTNLEDLLFDNDNYKPTKSKNDMPVQDDDPPTPLP